MKLCQNFQRPTELDSPFAEAVVHDGCTPFLFWSEYTPYCVDLPLTVFEKPGNGGKLRIWRWHGFDDAAFLKHRQKGVILPL
jgi:hypothetical protein